MAKKLSVMFDTNVYQNVLEPLKYQPTPHYSQDDVNKIYDAIKSERIDGYLSEVIFQIESLSPEDRKNF